MYFFKIHRHIIEAIVRAPQRLQSAQPIRKEGTIILICRMCVGKCKACESSQGELGLARLVKNCFACELFLSFFRNLEFCS